MGCGEFFNPVSRVRTSGYPLAGLDNLDQGISSRWTSTAFSPLWSPCPMHSLRIVLGLSTEYPQHEAVPGKTSRHETTPRSPRGPSWQRLLSIPRQPFQPSRLAVLSGRRRSPQFTGRPRQDERATCEARPSIRLADGRASISIVADLEPDQLAYHIPIFLVLGKLCNGMRLAV